MKEGWYYFIGDQFLEFVAVSDRGCDRIYEVPVNAICIAYVDVYRRVYRHTGNGEYQKISEADTIHELGISDVIKSQMLLFG